MEHPYAALFPELRGTADRTERDLIVQGLKLQFVARGKPYPSVMAPPDAVGETLTEVASRLLGAPSAG